MFELLRFVEKLHGPLAGRESGTITTFSFKKSIGDDRAHAHMPAETLALPRILRSVEDVDPPFAVDDARGCSSLAGAARRKTRSNMLKNAVIAALTACPAMALAQDSPPRAASPTAVQCFEVIALPAAQSEVDGPLLIDKCSGQTWFLARTRPAANIGREGYEWVPISLKTDTARADAKCFIFGGKRYCE